MSEIIFKIDSLKDLPPKVLMQIMSGVLSVCLAHHYQKADICNATKGTSVDFMSVRDTMYKYSKKAE